MNTYSESDYKLRNEFACNAMSALLAAGFAKIQVDRFVMGANPSDTSIRCLSEISYQIADAMMKQRDKHN